MSPVFSDFFLRTPQDWDYWLNHMRRLVDVKMLIDFSAYGTSIFQRSLRIQLSSKKLLQREDSSKKPDSLDSAAPEFLIFLKSQFKGQYVSLSCDHDIHTTVTELGDLSIIKRLPTVVS